MLCTLWLLAHANVHIVMATSTGCCTERSDCFSSYLISLIKNEAILHCLKLFQFPLAKYFFLQQILINCFCHLRAEDIGKLPKSKKKKHSMRPSLKVENKFLNCNCRQAIFIQDMSNCNCVRNCFFSFIFSF